MKTILLTLLLSANLFAFTAITSEGAYKINRSSKLFRDLSVGTQISGGQWMRARWAYVLQGGAATQDVILVDAEGLPAKLPANAIIYDCLIDVVTPVTAATLANVVVGFSSNAVADLKAMGGAVVNGVSTKQRVACVPTGSASTAVKMASEATLKLRIGSEALTGGRMDLFVNYVISEQFAPGWLIVDGGSYNGPPILQRQKMKVFSQLVSAQAENKASDYSAGTKGRFWFNTATSLFKGDDGSAVRVFVTLDNTQTLTNKTHTDPIIDSANFTQQSTPSNAASGKDKLYFKSDDNLYGLNSAGTEIQFATSTTVAPDSSYEISNAAIACSVSGNALTIALKGKDGNNPSGSNIVGIGFRNVTAATGTYLRRTVTSALSVVVSSGSTLGHTSTIESFIYVYAIDNAGTVELGVSTQAFDEGTVKTSTAEGGAGAADSGTILYSTTARTSKPIRLIARLRSTQTTAGTWAAAPTEIANTPFIKPAYPTVQSFTSGSGTYTTPTGCTYIRVKMVGGGGGGAGAGGTATSGGNGGNTTFGTTLLVANGGAFGTASGAGGTGGSASLGTGPIGLAIAGGAGSGCGRSNSGTASSIGGGNGGSSPFGGAGGGGYIANAGTAGVTNSGSGGGGGGSGSAVSVDGGAGGGSGGYVDAIIVLPSATYSYGVGAAGAAGAAGSGIAGSAGGSGFIIVEEYYT